jgi:mRNA-degrading endonuclease toxin of MazEF toxin-antitoxin module
VNPDQIYLAQFPFGDTPGMKLRPVLTLTPELGSVPEVLVAYISSVIPAVPMSSDILLDPTTSEHAATNLKTQSVVRLHNLATIHARNLVRYLGCLSPATSAEVDDKLRSVLGL